MTRFQVPRITIEKVQGDTLSLNFTLREAVSGDAIDVTGSSITFAVSRQRGDGAAIATATVGDGVTVTDAAAGQFSVSLELASADFDPGEYDFDLQLVTSGGQTTTHAIGSLKVLGEVAA